MLFRVLGPVAFGGPQHWHEPRGRLRRRLLATLLARAGQVVGHHQLAVALWGDPDGAPPASRLHLQVHRLRQDLASVDASARDHIEAVEDGYRLRIARDQLDATRFEDAARTVLATPPGDDSRSGTARRALREWPDPWHGQPYPGIDVTICLDEAARLEELRLQVIEAHIGGELRWARRLDELAALQDLAQRHPLRESLQALLMEALHQAGRQHEALEVYRATRTLLVEELGLEPSQQLRAAQELVLTSAEPVPTSRTPVPAQLPPAPVLVGRDEVIDELDARCGHPDAARCCVLTGPPGVGKTAVAVAWAVSRREQFPDGQLFVDLRGFGPDEPVEVDHLLDHAIRSLGGDPDLLRSTADRVATYRGLTVDRRLLVVLDNARTPDQVRPLLPSSPSSLTLVTSRDSLAGLVVREQAHRIDVGRLPMERAMTLLRGPRPVPQPDEARWRELARRCGRLPLLLRVARERVRTDPADLRRLGAAQVTAETLDLLDFGDPESSARSLFSWSYRALPGDAAAVFRAIGALPIPSVDVTTLAAMVDQDRRSARRAVDQLARAHLVGVNDGWVHQHDLIAAYAAECAEEIDPGERESMVARAVERWCTTYDEVRRRRDQDDIGTDEAVFDTVTEAMAWQGRAAHHTVALCAAASPAADQSVSRLHTHVHADLAHAGLVDAQLELGRLAQAAAQRLGDPRAEGQTEGVRGTIAGMIGDREGCIRSYTRAIDLLSEHGTLRDMVATHNNLGTEWMRFGNLPAASEQLDLALQAAAGSGEDDRTFVERAEPVVWGNVGRVQWLAGRWDEADATLWRALDRFAVIGRPLVSALPWVTLAHLDLDRGRIDEAVGHAERARDLASQTSDRGILREIELLLAATDLAVGLHDDALARLYRIREDPDLVGNSFHLTQVDIGLGDTLLARRDFGEALTHYERATVAARRRGHDLLQAEALQGQASVLRAVGRRAEAALGDRQATRLYESGGVSTVVRAG